MLMYSGDDCLDKEMERRARLEMYEGCDKRGALQRKRGKADVE